MAVVVLHAAPPHDGTERHCTRPRCVSEVVTATNCGAALSMRTRLCRRMYMWVAAASLRMRGGQRGQLCTLLAFAAQKGARRLSNFVTRCYCHMTLSHDTSTDLKRGSAAACLRQVWYSGTAAAASPVQTAAFTAHQAHS